MLRPAYTPAQRGGWEKGHIAVINGAEEREAGASARPHRARALLLSAATPQPDGPPTRIRAWRLLELLRATHEVHLIVRADGPIHYDLWRKCARLAGQWTLVPHSALLPGNRGVAAAVSQWASTLSFDVVACTSQRLWHAAARVPARVRFCDGRHDPALLPELLVPPPQVQPLRLPLPPLRRAA